MNEFRMLKIIGQAINDYDMIEDKDRIVAAISGGIDSIVMLVLLYKRLKYIPIKYELFPVIIDNFNGENEEYNKKLDKLKNYIFSATSTELKIIPVPAIEYLTKSHRPKRDICYLCAQKRRTELFKYANAIGAKKIALAHHKDDIVETNLMNMFYKRELSSMLPKLPLFNGTLTIIRPLAYLEKKEIEKYFYSNKENILIIGEVCPSKIMKRDFRRLEIRKLIEELESKIPGVKNNIFAAFRNPKPDYLLNYLFNPKTSGRFKRP
ncbi:MAG: ATP-binding protein [Brevinematia bacterium]